MDHFSKILWIILNTPGFTAFLYSVKMYFMMKKPKYNMNTQRINIKMKDAETQVVFNWISWKQQYKRAGW